MTKAVKHGHATNGWSPTYRSWISMRDRCRNPKNHRFAHYGQRGVTVCSRWDNFEVFLADMGERPEGTTLGRFNDVGNYEPNNCAWQTASQQAKRGSSNGRALLTEQQVLCIRALYVPHARRGCSSTNMANDLGVSFAVIDRVVRRETWRHV
jgi:hypothetical protein